MRRAVIYLFFSLFCFGIFFCHACLAVGPTKISYSVDSPSTWTKDNGPYIVQNHVVVNAPLTIEEGTVVKFATNSADLTIRKDFHVNGTRYEPVVFTSIKDDSRGGDTNGDGTKTQANPSDWSAIHFNPFQDYEMKIKYAEVRYSSFGVNINPTIGQTKDISVKNSKLEKNGVGILIGNAEPLIESNTITQNTTGIKVNNISGKKTKAINNSVTNNTTGAYGKSSVYPDTTVLEAEHNWWGDETGPQNEKNPDGKGNSATGQISFDPWTKEDPLQTPDPAIVIPGIMGSWEKDGKWKIDPIFHTYDDLLKAFLNAGYPNDGKKLSVFPYQWRDSNIENAKLLHERIQQIKEDTGRPKIDIIAHSMGGLLAREYIESGYYEDDVDQLITVGTPHLGAPKDYLSWDGGVFGPKIEDYILEKVFKQEAKEKGFDDIFHYIHGRPIKSVEELLPTYNYLFNADNNYVLRATYPVDYPQNEFLDNLNINANLQPLKNLEFTKIIGIFKKEEDTISGFNIVDSNDKILWQHGYPEKYWLITGSRGLVRGCGDGTVPCHSAKSFGVPSYHLIELDSRHNNLPTDAQQDILEILTGKKPSNKIDEWQIDDILAGFVFSPVDIQIISPSGKRLGKNFETGGEYSEIPGAYYTGYRTNTEFFVIPNPEDGEYKILTQGTGIGEYRVEITKISDSADGADEVEIEITGTAEPGKQEGTSVKVEGMKVEKMTVPEPGNGNGTNSSVIDPVGIEVSIKVSTDSPSRIQKLDLLKGKIRQYFKSNQIKKRKEAGKVMNKLNHIRIYLKRYETEISSKKMKISKMKANRDISKLIRWINKKTPKSIIEEARNSLVEDIGNLKI